MLFAFALPIALFTACDDDDDDEEDATGNSTSTEKTHLLTGIYYSGSYIYQFEYDEDGNLTSYNDNVVTYNPMKIVTSDGDIYYDFTTNNSGYITGFSIMEEDGDKDNSYVCTMTYDSNNHLTKITGKCSYETESSVSTTKIEESACTVITWNSNNYITKIAQSIECEQKKTIISTSYTSTYTYNYENATTYSYNETYYNKTKQYPYSPYRLAPALVYGYSGFRPDIEALSLVGLLGIGPIYLPNEHSLSYYNYNSVSDPALAYYTEDEDEGEITRSFSYSFNSDGTIYKSDGYYYLYDGDTY